MDPQGSDGYSTRPLNTAPIPPSSSSSSSSSSSNLHQHLPNTATTSSASRSIAAEPIPAPLNEEDLFGAELDRWAEHEMRIAAEEGRTSTADEKKADIRNIRTMGKFLSLQEENFTTFPAAICRIKNSFMLYIYANRFTVLPDDIIQATGLAWMDVDAETLKNTLRPKHLPNTENPIYDTLGISECKHIKLPPLGNRNRELWTDYIKGEAFFRALRERWKQEKEYILFSDIKNAANDSD